MSAPDENELDGAENEKEPDNELDECATDETAPLPVVPLESDDVSAPFYTRNPRQSAWLRLM